jgi:hypothetical protein
MEGHQVTGDSVILDRSQVTDISRHISVETWDSKTGLRFGCWNWAVHVQTNSEYSSERGALSYSAEQWTAFIDLPLSSAAAIAQPLDIFSTFHRNVRFIAVFTRALHWPLQWVTSISPIHYIPPISLRSSSSILSATSAMSYYWPRSSLLSHKNVVCIPLLYNSCYFPCPSHPWLVKCNETWRRIQATELFIMQFLQQHEQRIPIEQESRAQSEESVHFCSISQSCECLHFHLRLRASGYERPQQWNFWRANCKGCKLKAKRVHSAETFSRSTSDCRCSCPWNISQPFSRHDWHQTTKWYSSFVKYIIRTVTCIACTFRDINTSRLDERSLKCRRKLNHADDTERPL